MDGSAGGVKTSAQTAVFAYKRESTSSTTNAYMTRSLAPKGKRLLDSGELGGRRGGGALGIR